MANFTFQRDYRFTDPDLTNFTQHICDSMTRDISNFAVFGVTALAVTNLQTLCDDFEIFPTDDYIYQEFLTATEAKDALFEEMRGIVRNMALRVELKWGKSSAKYRSLGISDLSQISDEAFITRARMAFAFMTENKTELASEGLTQGMLDDMEDKIQLLDDAKRLQIEKSSLRAEKTVERVENGNEVYGFVTRYCEIGKRIWDGINPAKFDDYVIYGGGGGLGAPTGVDGIFGATPSAHIDMTWNLVTGATNYDIFYSMVEISEPEGTFSLLQNVTELPATLTAILNKQYYFYVVAKNTTQTSAHSTTISVQTVVEPT